MTHPILAAIDDLDTKIGNSADLKAGDAAELGLMLDRMRDRARHALNPPVPGSTMGIAGATITHRPDVVYGEAQRQAAMQGDADRFRGHDPKQTVGGYLPLHKAPLTTAVINGSGGTIQEQAKPHPAEHAVIGGEQR